MASLIPKKQPITHAETEEKEDQESLNPAVSSHLYLKPTHSSETLDKDVVLRRIRHRKRLNKVRNALEGFLGWSIPSKSDDKAVSLYETKWVDDAFAAP